MNVLLLGGGGRESALAYKLSRSPYLNQLLIVGGNPSMSTTGTLVSSQEVLGSDEPLCWQSPDHIKRLAQWSTEAQVDLVVSGPEAPICANLEGAMSQEDIACFAPTQILSQLESSKKYAKQLMNKSRIPTAPYTIATSFHQAYEQALDILKSHQGVVLKADGLAGGKGVFVCQNEADVGRGIKQLEDSMSHACKTILCEHVLTGYECSYFAFVSGPAVIPMGFVRDYKRLYDDDKGPNTGGMGAHTALTHLPDDAEQQVFDQILEPLLTTLKHQNLSYTGFLYIGLMWTDKGPYVLEFNVRIGDPECQVLAVADSSDWLDSIMTILCASSHVSPLNLIKHAHPLAPTLAVVCTCDRYPISSDQSTTSYPLPNWLWDRHENESFWTFAAAVKKSAPQTYHTQHGRVLTLVAQADTIAHCRDICNRKVQSLMQSWPVLHARTDIGVDP